MEAFEEILPMDERVHLEIVGAGPLDNWMADYLRRSAHAARIHWHGSIAPDEVPRFLRRMDVVLAPYPELRGFYFSPLKLYEYLASGRAIVASAAGQIADVVEHDDNGLLVPPGDAWALARACLQLAGSESLRERLGQRARECATRHTWEQNARAVLSHIEATLH